MAKQLFNHDDLICETIRQPVSYQIEIVNQLKNYVCNKRSKRV
jgi:hypothetical protein